MDQTTGDMRPSDPYIEPIPDVNAADYEEQVAAGNDVTYAELTERSATGGVTPDESSDDIREDIEQTRSNMGETIDAIQERLSPERLARQAKDVVHDATIGRVEQTMNDMTDSAREGGYTLMDTIRQNPIPAALAGIGVGWLVMKVRENADRRAWERNWNRDGAYGRSYQGGFQRQYEPYRQYGQYPSGYRYQGVQQGGQSLTDKAQDKMGRVADKAQDKMGQVTDKAQDMGDQLQDQAQQVASQAQYQAYRARNWLERTMDENPLAVGLVAVAAGALAGMAVPETDQERMWMGPARDQLVEKAQDVAQVTADKAQRVAQQATEAAKDAAKDEAKNQNLTH